MGNAATDNDSPSGPVRLSRSGWEKGSDSDRWDDDRWDERQWDRSSGKSDEFELPVTPVLLIIGICVLVMLFSLAVPGLVYTQLALKGSLLSVRPWTILTHIFVHADFSHLFWNMLALFFFGTQLENRIGERRFLMVFLVSGLVGGLAEVLFSSGFIMGASGAVMGIMGCLALLAPEIRVIIFPIPLPISITVAIILFAAIDLFYQMSLGGSDGIAHMAHLAGLGAGLLFGNMLGRRGSY